MPSLVDHSGFRNRARPGKLRLRTADCIPMLLAVVWFFAALTKAFNFESFHEVVGIHSVLPGDALQFLWLVPLGEGAIGFALLMTVASEPRVRTHRLALTGAVLVLLLFAAYIGLVPEAVVEAVGCGCFGVGGIRFISGMPISYRMTSLALTGILIAAHAIAFEWSARPRTAETA